MFLYSHSQPVCLSYVANSGILWILIVQIRTRLLLFSVPQLRLSCERAFSKAGEIIFKKKSPKPPEAQQCGKVIFNKKYYNVFPRNCTFTTLPLFFPLSLLTSPFYHEDRHHINTFRIDLFASQTSLIKFEASDLSHGVIMAVTVCLAVFIHLLTQKSEQSTTKFQSMSELIGWKASMLIEALSHYSYG